MADNGEILDFLRACFGRIDDRFDRIDQKLDEVVTRLGRLEREVAGLHVLTLRSHVEEVVAIIRRSPHGD